MKSLLGPNSMPNSAGGSVVLTPRSSPNHPGREKKISPMAKPLASVTMARLAPRVRSDGMAAIRPNPTPAATASGSATNSGICAWVPKDATENAPIPARAICISEIWPT